MALIQRYIALVFIASIASSSPAIAGDERTLSSVAAADNFTYSWLPTEAGAVLTRPGVRVVIRSGRIFYEVDNATLIADRAPTFNGQDLLISPALAARLDEIAKRSSPSLVSAPASYPARTTIERASEKSRPITIETTLIPGRSAMMVKGTGAPNTSLTITLTGEISKELPVVLIRRITVPIDARGTYAVQMSYGPDAHAKTVITVTAASASGTDNAVAHLTVDGSPTGGTSTGLDEWPKN